MSRKHTRRKAKLDMRSGVDGIRQQLFPREFRIDAPQRADVAAVSAPDEVASKSARQTDAASVADDRHATSDQLAEIAICLWYLKTKHFKRAWDDMDAVDDDPRVRRALGRLEKGIQTLRAIGLEVQDPTHKRFPAGGESLMRPLQFQPTAGVTVEVVSETVSPIVFLHDRPIRRGEVFVAVPLTGDPSPGAA